MTAILSDTALSYPCLDRDRSYRCRAMLSIRRRHILSEQHSETLILSYLPPTTLSYQAPSHLIISSGILSASTERSLPDYLIYPTMSYLYQSSTQRRLSYLTAPGTILSGTESSYQRVQRSLPGYLILSPRRYLITGVPQRCYLISRGAILSSGLSYLPTMSYLIRGVPQQRYLIMHGVISSTASYQRVTETILSVAKPSYRHLISETAEILQGHLIFGGSILSASRCYLISRCPRFRSYGVHLISCGAISSSSKLVSKAELR